MFKFQIMRMVAEEVRVGETDVWEKVSIKKPFTIIVDLKTETAIWEGQKQTPFEMGPEILAWVKEQVK